MTLAAKLIKHPPVLWGETQKLFSQLAAALTGPVLAYFTARSWSIEDDDVKYFYTHLKKIGYQKRLYFILISHGGNGQSAWRIACLLRNFCDELYVVLPEAAASAATILSLAADRILMTPLAYLTAVDTSIYHPLNPKDRENRPVYVELDEVNRSLNTLLQKTGKKTNTHEVYKTIFNYIHPVALGAITRSTNLSEMLCSDIMELQNEPPSVGQKRTIIKQLNTNYPSHSYPIPRHKAKELGLRVAYTEGTLDALLGALLEQYVAITKPTQSYPRQTAIHTESVNTIIESADLRFSLHHTLQKRLNPIVKDWLTLQDEMSWVVVNAEQAGVEKVVENTPLAPGAARSP